jgi:hypothetical protein
MTALSPVPHAIVACSGVILMGILWVLLRLSK